MRQPYQHMVHPCRRERAARGSMHEAAHLVRKKTTSTDTPDAAISFSWSLRRRAA
jgi:hypothetical protein